MSFKSVLLTAVFGLSMTCAAQADTFPPPMLDNGANPNPGIIITFNANGSITTSGTDTPYVTEDEYIEIVNNTSSNIKSLNLVTPTGAPIGIFAFDSDGIDNYGGGTNALDHTGYGGGDAYFTNISPGDLTGTVNFLGTGINGAGGEGYFSLEGIIALNQGIIQTPEPASIAILGMGLAGLTLMRRRKASML